MSQVHELNLFHLWDTYYQPSLQVRDQLQVNFSKVNFSTSVNAETRISTHWKTITSTYIENWTSKKQQFWRPAGSERIHVTWVVLEVTLKKLNLRRWVTGYTHQGQGLLGAFLGEI